MKKHQGGPTNEKGIKNCFFFFFSEDHFISFTAKKSNTVNCTLNICVEHLFSVRAREGAGCGSVGAVSGA